MTQLECEILSSFINYPSKISEFLSLSPLTCFSKEGQEVLHIINALNERNALSYNSFLESLNAEQAKSEAIISILSTIPNPNVENTAHIFKQGFLLEAQRQAGLKLLRASDNNTLLSLETLMPNITQSDYKTATQWQSYYDAKPREPKVKTGISFLDSVFDGGIECAQLILISGDPEAGKTTLGLQILENIANTQKVCFFSFEFPISTYLKRKSTQKQKIKADNVFIIDNGYEIYQISEHIKTLHKTQGVKVFLIDSQMRIVSPNGRNMEEEESLKFSTLAKLCHSLGVIVFLIVQTSKGDRDNPMGSKKGGHEASIIIRIEHDKPENANIREFAENSRIVILKKNKQTGKHYKERVSFDSNAGKFLALSSSDYQDLEVVEI